ncbi:TPA: hypothetical protein ACLNO8_003690, partial [Vibrio cholerae O1]
ATKLQKDLAQVRQSQQDTTERHRAETAQLQNDLGEARQRLGVAEGSLQAMGATNQQQAEQLQSLRSALAQRDTDYALLQRDLESSHGKASALEQELRQLRAASPARTDAGKPKRSRKAVSP